MRYLILAILLAAPAAHAETLVLTQLKGYQRPAQADIVKVLRTPASVWAPLAEVLPTERIQVCMDDPAVLVGSTTSCSTRIPGRTDNWQLKSLAIQPQFGSVTFAWEPVTVNMDGSPVTLAGYTVIVRRQNCIIGTDAGCVVADRDPPLDLGNVLTFTVANVAKQACLIVQARTDTNDRGVISDEPCGAPTIPRPMPAQVTGVRVVP